jgi:hypothetical protein
MLRHFILPIASQWCIYEETHFMQDGAPPHFTLPVRAWLYSHFVVGGLGVEDQ